MSYKNKIVYRKLVAHLIKILFSGKDCLFASYISFLLRKKSLKCVFKHFVHKQFNFQQVKLSLFIDEEIFACCNNQSPKKVPENLVSNMILAGG